MFTTNTAVEDNELKDAVLKTLEIEKFVKLDIQKHDFQK